MSIIDGTGAQEPGKTGAFDSNFLYDESMGNGTFPDWAKLYYREARAVYAVAIPCLLGLCAAGIICNLIVVVVSLIRSGKRSSLTFNLTLSLAGTDAWSLLLIALGLIFNSYLPFVHQIYWTNKNCHMFLLEAVRLGGVETSVLHILALSLNQFFAANSPSQYRTVSLGKKRHQKVLLLGLWFIPPLFFYSVFVINIHDTFLSKKCQPDLLKSSWFPTMVFYFVLIPLVIILALYVGLTWRLRQARVRLESRQIPSTSDEYRRSSTHDSFANHHVSRYDSPCLSAIQDHRNSFCCTANARSNGSSSAEQIRTLQLHQMRRSIGRIGFQRRCRMCWTIICIVGTFSLGWIPATVWYAVTCAECAYSIRTLMEKSPRFVYCMGIVVNCLIISKGLINPMLYAFRVPEIQACFRRLNRRWDSSIFGARNARPARVPAYRLQSSPQSATMVPLEPVIKKTSAPCTCRGSGANRQKHKRNTMPES